LSGLGVAIPFWLDRPDEEAVEIALGAERAGIERLWIGEMDSLDAFALATATGLRTERLRLTVGPLAVGVRSPVDIARGIASVATLTGRPVDVALGSSSPLIVSGWHDRPWSAPAARMREALLGLRVTLDGKRTDLDGVHVRSHGFKLRRPQPEASITVGAFGPQVTRVAARHADGVVLNLVPPEHVSRVRALIEREAAAAGRPTPRVAVWVPAALDPGERALAQLTGQLAVYLGATGYGDMFAALGFGALVEHARAGARRVELAAEIPLELLTQVGAIGDATEVAASIDAYHAAGADHVAVVPSTAEDPGGRRVLEAIARQARRSLVP
jgi:probable F420-dependent oxidoreductase